MFSQSVGDQYISRALSGLRMERQDDRSRGAGPSVIACVLETISRGRRPEASEQESLFLRAPLKSQEQVKSLESHLKTCPVL